MKNGPKREEENSMRKYIQTAAICAAVMCAASMVSCQKTPSQPAKTYTLSVDAVKADTKALALDGKNLIDTWSEGDDVKVLIPGSTSVIGHLRPTEAGTASSTLKGDVTLTNVSVGDNLELLFPISWLTYSGQNGSLEKIASTYNYSSATVTVTGLSGEIIVTSPAEFSSMQSIVKFELLDKADDSALMASTLTISAESGKMYGESDYSDLEIWPGTATNEYFVAIRNDKAGPDTYTLTAKVGSKTYTYTRSGVEFANGTYRKVTVKMTEVIPDTYTVAGSSSKVFGASWDTTVSSNDMELQADGTYRKTYRLDGSEGSIQFKICKNHSWDESWPESNYNISSAPGTLVITFDGTNVNAYIQPDYVYTVAGAPYGVFGSSWEVSDTDNDMVKMTDGTYRKTYGLDGSEGTIKFKICANHAWDESWPDYNYEISSTPGTLVITFNGSTVNAYIIPDGVYTVVGDSDSVFGTRWDEYNTANDMVKQADGMYRKTYTVDGSEGTIRFKVYQDRYFYTAWPSENYTYTISTAGTFYVFFDPDTNEVDAGME